MTKEKQSEILKLLKKEGYRASIFRHGKSWRLKASVGKGEKILHVREDWERDQLGRMIWDRENHQWKRKEVQELRQVELSLTLIQKVLREQGFNYAKLIRNSSSDAVFEVDHDHNFWKILQEE